MSGQQAAAEYTGPETNEVYEDESMGPSFDDLGDEDFTDMTGEPEEDSDVEVPEGDDSVPKYKREPKTKTQEKEELTDRILETIDTQDEETTEQEPQKEKGKEDPKAEAEKPEGEAKTEETPKDEKGEKVPKGKKVYLKVGEDTFAVDPNATIPHKVDGKPVNVTVQELLNDYSGRKSWDSKFNEINLKSQEVQKKEAAITQTAGKVKAFVDDLISTINDPESDPETVLEKIAEYYESNVDGAKVNLYDFQERSFKSKLTMLANVLNMSDEGRKAYFLEKRNEALQKQTEKREAKLAETSRVTSYRQKLDTLRKSYGVTEAQYVDALEELKSFGYEDKDLAEQQIVEWAAIKPHKAEVTTLLEPYQDQISSESYGELVYKLANLLRENTTDKDTIIKHLQEVYGIPTEVKELASKLQPVGRPKGTPSKEASVSKKQSAYESFDDFEDD